MICRFFRFKHKRFVMKKAMVIMLIFCLPTLVPAQKKYFRFELKKHYRKVYQSKINHSVVLSLDTIFKSGVPYAILKKKKQIPYNNYFLYSVNHEELIQIYTRSSSNTDNTLYYAFKFTGSGKTAEAEKYYGFSLEKEIVKNELVINNQVDPFKETLFLEKYPRIFSDLSLRKQVSGIPENKVNGENMYEPVERDRNSEYYYREGKIIQDYKIVAQYKVLEDVTRFYLPSGILVAEARKNENGNWQIRTLKDRKSGEVKFISDVREVIAYLLKGAYI